MTTLVNRYDIPALVDHYKFKYLVETGTGFGESVYHNAKCFKKVYTFEVHPETYEMAKDTLETVQNVTMYNIESIRGLPLILPFLDGPTLFYLDARFPGKMLGDPINFDEEITLNVPTKRELEIITQNRKIDYDMFIIGGMNIWMDAAFTAGVFTSKAEFKDENPIPIIKQFEFGHFVTLNTLDEGYMSMRPKRPYNQ